MQSRTRFELVCHAECIRLSCSVCDVSNRVRGRGGDDGESTLTQVQCRASDAGGPVYARVCVHAAECAVHRETECTPL